jgi:hypothetical protein
MVERSLKSMLPEGKNAISHGCDNPETSSAVFNSGSAITFCVVDDEVVIFVSDSLEFRFNVKANPKSATINNTSRRSRRLCMES